MKNKFKYLYSFAITILFLLFIYYMNGLYPFDNYSILKVDADYQYIPVLYHIYDFLHGNGNIFYDDIGLGNNIYISMIIQGSLYSPLNLLLYFTSRNNLVNYFNIILLFKISLISLTTYIYINYKSKNINEFYKILFSVLFAFNGFVLLNYFNHMWLDCLILFPLIVMFLDKLIFDNNNIGYIITLSLSLIISFYISYYILIFILFYSFIYLFMFFEKDKRKKIIFKLGIATFISFLISSFSVIPAIYQVIISSRINVTSDYVMFSDTMLKSLHLLFSPLFIILSIKYLFNFKKNVKEIYCYLLLLILFSIGVIIEPINLSIHGGSHWCFPYRYGFITTFIMLMGSVSYIDKYDKKDIKDKKRPYNFIFVSIFFVFLVKLVLVLNGIFANSIVDNMIFLNLNDSTLYLKIIIFVVIFMVMYLLCFILRRQKILMYTCLSIVSFLSIYIFSSWVMFYADGYFLSNNANEINDTFDINDDGRYKVNYEVYTPDYGFILNVDTLDNWLHVIPDSELDIYKKLGYGYSDTCIRSYGGTIFTDYLLNFQYLFSNYEIDNDDYKLISKNDNKYLYRFTNNSLYGVVYNNDIEFDYLNPFDYQNQIYHTLFNDENDIIDIENYQNVKKIHYEIDDLEYIYFYSNNNIDSIIVNGESILNIGNFIKDLGQYDTDIDIEIVFNNDEDLNFSIGSIKYNSLNKLNSNVEYKNGTYYVNSDGDNKLFIPINNISGIKVYNNGELVKTGKFLNNFITVDLVKGENKIKIEYKMPFWYLGIIFSILGILLLFFLKYFNFKKIYYNIVYYIYIIIVFFFFSYYYFYSLFK